MQYLIRLRRAEFFMLFEPLALNDPGEMPSIGPHQDVNASSIETGTLRCTNHVSVKETHERQHTTLELVTRRDS
jgi:hypothetical protein